MNFKNLVFSASLLITAQATANENLWSIYLKALHNDPAFQQQQYTYAADQEFIEQAKGILRPQISATAGVGRINNDIDTELGLADGDATLDNSNLAISLSQTLWNKGQFENLKLSKKQVAQSRLQLENERQNLFLRVSDRYFNLLAAEDTLTVSQQEKQTLQQQFDQAKELLDAGLGTSIDYFQSESRLRIAEVDILNAQNAIADNRQALAQIIGEPVQSLSRPSENYPIIDPQPADLNSWTQTAYQNNYELAVFQQQADVALSNIEIARSGHWPSLSLNAQQSYNDDNGGISADTETKQRRITLDLAAPIYQGGQIKSQTREASQRYNASLKSVDTVARSVERRVQDAYNTVITSKNQVSALLSAVKSAQNALEARQQSFESGLSTNVEVLDATRDLYSAERDLLQARYNYITGYFRLKSLAGVLNEIDFKQTSELLTP